VFITMIKHLWQSSTAKESHGGHCPRWLALPVCMILKTMDLVWDSTTQEIVEPNADERERAMGFSMGTTNVPGLSEHQQQFLLGQAMDVNYMTWIVSLVVAEQKRLASSLVGYMGFYELRAAMEPPPLVMMPGKVVGGEEASTAHPWNMWNFRIFVTKDRARELHGQNSEFAYSRINLEEQVDKMFLKEHTA
jgi:hypothetical protein